MLYILACDIWFDSQLSHGLTRTKFERKENFSGKTTLGRQYKEIYYTAVTSQIGSPHKSFVDCAIFLFLKLLFLYSLNRIKKNRAVGRVGLGGRSDRVDNSMSDGKTRFILNFKYRNRTYQPHTGFEYLEVIIIVIGI